jgi:hypothetical protein
VTKEFLVKNAKTAAAKAEEIGFPVVLKGSGPELLHKTELDIVRLNLKSAKEVRAAFKEIKAGKEFGDVAEKYTMRSGYKEKKGMWGLTPNSSNEISSHAATLAVDSISQPFEHANGWSIIKVLGKDSSRVKTFEEAKPELMSTYQESAAKLRQDEWVTELKQRYPVVLNREMLMQAFKRKPVATQ